MLVKTYSRLGQAFVSILAVTLGPIQARAIMDPPRFVSVPALIQYLSTSEKKGLSNDQSAILKLAQFGQNAFHIKYFCSYCSRQELLQEGKGQMSEIGAVGQQIQLRSMADNIAAVIQVHPRWGLTLSVRELAFLKANREVFQNAFAPNPYVWAWCLYQLGEKSASHDTLKSRFEAMYKYDMALEEYATFHKGDSTTSAEDYYVQALDVMAPKAETRELKKKLNEIKVHISNIPQLQFMTTRDLPINNRPA